MTHKYAHIFAIVDLVCEPCGGNVRPHSLALVSNSRSFANAERVKTCERCGTTSPEPVYATENLVTGHAELVTAAS